MMGTLLVMKEQLKGIYAKYSFYITVGLRFFMGLLVFGLINSNVGFMEKASSLIVTFGLAAVCAFFPLIIMTMAATVLVLAHLYTLSIVIAVVAAVFFLLMYIFYFRFTSRKSWLVLLTAVGFALKVPLVVPVAIGLLGTPVCLVPAVCGTFTYYMLHFVRSSSSTLKEGGGLSALTDGGVSFIKQCLLNKEMLVMTAVVILCVLVVYGVRRCSVDHAWKIATGAGVVTAIIVAVGGNVALNLHISYASLVGSGVLAVGVGLLLEVLFLSVDYSRTEFLEFEDDEYHYYVKAVPKVGVTIPEKSVKQINARQDEADVSQKNVKKQDNVMPETHTIESTEEILLTRSLNKELGLDETKQVK